MEPLRVFIVDDDKDFAESLGIALEGNGCEVELAHSGEQAIKAFQDKNFDLALMDVKLPGLNGVESFLEIQKIKPGLKVIMMTGYSVEQLLDQAVENGAWGVIHKPIDVPKLLDMIQKIGEDGILIADDDPDFVATIKHMLSDLGYRVLIAVNGEEAIERILENHIDILILDLRMPVLNGLDTYTKLKKMGRVVPTIIVTAFSEEEKHAVETLSTEAVYGVLKKPFDPKELLAVIRQVMQKKGREKYAD
ncbi:MAG: response regulator [Deltaproteobacteria bacterium]|nr:response regulator [Deltaproteobacteria bacterium]